MTKSDVDSGSGIKIFNLSNKKYMNIRRGHRLTSRQNELINQLPLKSEALFITPKVEPRSSRKKCMIRAQMKIGTLFNNELIH